ncbi:DUF998 domain-containing protein [Brevibacterium sp. FAM 25378]|uniref:DUF998 domain-containing protein n=1 Tax=unclassified Brevibacterium TaxID=2614124 RepID=UPI0010926ED3|nr:DUF998 domain-containing protein [Brevibacterium sp. S22]TGD27951.1 DUF998 domain-containing protein [Brevibacterium sp. S22]
MSPSSPTGSGAPQSSGATALEAGDFPARTRRARIGAVLLIVNAADYILAEAITAAAWQNPAYSYSFNYISDLGAPDVARFQGRMVDSPLHMVMNTGFIIHGIIFIAAAVLVQHAITRTGPRRTYLVLAALHGIGISLVGLFHGSQAAIDDGTAALHGLGALLAIGAGNIAAIIMGIHFARNSRRGTSGRGSVGSRGSGGRRGVGWVLAGLGITGLAAFAYLLATTGTDIDGIPERIAVYTIMVAEVIARTTLSFLGVRDTQPKCHLHPAYSEHSGHRVMRSCRHSRTWRRNVSAESSAVRCARIADSRAAITSARPASPRRRINRISARLMPTP